MASAARRQIIGGCTVLGQGCGLSRQKGPCLPLSKSAQWMVCLQEDTNVLLKLTTTWDMVAQW